MIWLELDLINGKLHSRVSGGIGSIDSSCVSSGIDSSSIDSNVIGCSSSSSRDRLEVILVVLIVVLIVVLVVVLLVVVVLVGVVVMNGNVHRDIPVKGHDLVSFLWFWVLGFGFWVLGLEVAKDMDRREVRQCAPI